MMTPMEIRQLKRAAIVLGALRLQFKPQSNERLEMLQITTAVIKAVKELEQKQEKIDG